jgi:adenylylsulfate kinase-like enzyme
MDGTQYNALNTIQSWAESSDGEPIFWLVGMAGTGKSSIARTVANCLNKRRQFFSREPQLDERTILGATFFMSQEDPDRNTAKLVFPTRKNVGSEFSRPRRSDQQKLLS